jgi:autoinducer 2 (AI-2) kinase
VSADRVLVIDAGTSALRAVLVAADGDASLIAVEPYRMFVPDDAAPFGREFAPHELDGALRRLVEAAAQSSAGIAAVAFTGQREGIAFIDGDGEAVFASPNVDGRASAEGIGIDAARAAEVYAVTGHLPSLMQAPAKLAWLRRHRPDVASRVRQVLPLVDWLAMRLSGAPAMSRGLAAENGVLDVASGDVPLALLDAAGFDAPLLPRVVADGSVAGEVRGGALAGRPVVLAGADTQCGLLGMGVFEPGDAGVPVGWSAPLQMVTAAPVFDCEKRTWTSVHAAPGRWILESNAGETGRGWVWICSMLDVTPGEAERLAAASPAGSNDMMSVLGARAMRAAEMTASMGAMTFPLPLVMSAPGRGDVLRSVLEGAAYAIRGNLEQLEAVSTATVKRLRVGGGMSRSALFARIVADVVDRPVEVARTPETSAVGAAALALAAIGRYGSIAEAVDVMSQGRRIVKPHLAASAAYEDYYARWCALSDELARLASEIG